MQALRNTELSVLQGRLAVIATANRISASADLLNGRRLDGRLRFELAAYDAALAFLADGREPQVIIEEHDTPIVALIGLETAGAPQ